MADQFRSHPRSYLYWLPLSLLGAGLILFLMAPEEETIGSGIKIVYVHVAFIWTGLLGLLVSGILGLVILFRDSVKIEAMMVIAARLSALFFGVGVATSLIAEQINWGGIAWQEPRTRANLNLLALVLIAQVLGSWLQAGRFKGALNMLLALVTLIMVTTTPLELHPADPIRSSTSTLIQLTFYGLFLVCVTLACWIAWFQYRRLDLTT